MGLPGATACLLQNEPASHVHWQVNVLLKRGSRRETESEQGVWGVTPVSVRVDPKPGDLPMARLQAG